MFDDGSGPALYVGGDFTTAGGVAANHIAKWDGSSWSPLGSGMNFVVRALTVFDDGTGLAALYAGGAFASAFDSGDSYLAKWGCPVTAVGHRLLHGGYHDQRLRARDLGQRQRERERGVGLHDLDRRASRGRSRACSSTA